MRLSVKFFCAAYLIVLLASGICGMVVIRSVTDALWDARVQQTETAAAYVAESWTALTDLSPGKLSEAKRTAMLRQIEASLLFCHMPPDIFLLPPQDAYLQVSERIYPMWHQHPQHP